MTDRRTVETTRLTISRLAERRARASGRRTEALWRCALMGLAAALCILSCAVSAATFVLKSGERLEGEVIHATRNTLMVRETIGRIRQLSHGDVQSVEITTADGQVVSGVLLGWHDGVYDIRSEDEETSVEGRTIVETATARPPVLTVSNAEAVEGAAELVFRIDLSEPAGRSIFIVYGTFDRTAKAGDDYREQRGSVEIQAGDSSSSVRIPVVDDDVAEDDETFEVFVTADEALASIGNKRAVGTILNDD